MAIARTRGLAALVAAAAAITLVGCAPGSPSSTTAPTDDSGSQTELTHITVGAPSVGPSSALQFGLNQGWFAENGLDPEIKIGVAGAALLPAVSTGQTMFGVSNPLSVLTAASKGVDVVILSGYSFSKATGDDINCIVVRADSDINTWADLTGKRVSVNAVKTQGDLTINAVVDADGGDSSLVEYNEIPFPDALATLDQGNTDAVWIPEPFMSIAKASPDKYRVLGYPNQAALPGMPAMVTFTSGKFYNEHPDLVAAWRATMAKTLENAVTDREAYAEVVADVLGTPVETTLKQNPDSLGAEIDPAIITALTDMAVKYGFLESAPDLDTVIAK